MILLFAGLFGFLSVALGAYADHGLQGTASPADLKSFMNAIKYHQLHSVALMALGLARIANPKGAASKLLLSAGLAFIAAILLFCFSIYASVIFETPGLKNLAPLGGTLFMIGWLILAFTGWKQSRK